MSWPCSFNSRSYSALPLRNCSGDAQARMMWYPFRAAYSIASSFQNRVSATQIGGRGCCNGVGTTRVSGIL